MTIKLIYSNQIHALAEQLSKEIFRKILITPNKLLLSPIIIVPNPYLEKWLKLKITEDSGISMNLNFYYQDQGIWKLLSLLDPDRNNKPVIMDNTDLNYYLIHIFSEQNHPQNNLKPFIDYLFDKLGNRKLDFERRIIQLSEKISKKIIDYELYRPLMIQSWINGIPLSDTGMELAQMTLYNIIFGKNGLRDTINPHQQTLAQYFNLIKSNLKTHVDVSVFFFGLSHISPLHSSMIYEIGDKVDLEIFQLNPCSEFWEDVSSPSEDRWNRIKFIPVQKSTSGEDLLYAEFENPLLKQWGKPGRESVKILSMLENSGSMKLAASSEFITYYQSQNSYTMLTCIQDQILHRTTVLSSDKKMFQDKSIQIIACPDIFREVEGVYYSIISNLENDSSITMSDIAVMVPDMEHYEPVIRTVFDRTPRILSYSLIDSTASLTSIYADGLRSLFLCAQGTCNRNEVFTLIQNECFMTAQKISFEDAMRWFEWAEELNIFHNINSSENEKDIPSIHTWDNGLLRLRLGRIMNSSDHWDFKSTIPCKARSGDDDSIETISTTMELLFQMIKDIISTPKTASEWIATVIEFADIFLILPESYPAENLVRDAFIADLQRLEIFDRLTSNSSSLLTFDFIVEYVVSHLQGLEKSCGSYLISGINISSLVPRRQIPFKILYMMGMQEGIFPGSPDPTTIDLMNTYRNIGDISRPDANRYIFLENVILTEKKIYITYISRDLQRDQEFQPNSIVTQLIAYLEKYVIGNSFKKATLPLSSISSEYLYADNDSFQWSDFLLIKKTEGFDVNNYSNHDRVLLFGKTSEKEPQYDESALISNVNKKQNYLIKSEQACSISSAPDSKQIKSIFSMTEIRDYLKNPFEATMQRHLKFYNDIQPIDLRDAPFYSIFPFNYNAIIDTLNTYVRSRGEIDIELYFKKYYQRAMLTGETPNGSFSKLDYEILSQSIKERLSYSDHQSLTEFIKMRKNSKFFCNISIGHVHVTDATHIQFPSFMWTDDISGNSLEIQGSLPNVWINENTGEIETLFITGSSKFHLNQLILPFLFFNIACGGYIKELSDLIGQTCSIHISHNTGIFSTRYKMDRSDCRKYCESIFPYMLNENDFDMIPFDIITNKKNSELDPLQMHGNPTQKEMNSYRNTLIDTINESSENLFSSHQMSPSILLATPEVPGDVYTKVFQRYRPILRYEESNEIEQE